MVNQILTGLIIIILTVLTGLGDAKGFYHASRAWDNNNFILNELIKSALGFLIGISAYWMLIKYLQQYKIITPELQTIGWFGVTIIGVALLSGKFFNWSIIDQILAITAILCIALLIIRVNI